MAAAGGGCREAGDNWKVSLWPSKLELETHPQGRQVTCPGSSDPWVLAVVTSGSASELLSRYRSPSHPSQSRAGCLSPGVVLLPSFASSLTHLGRPASVGPYCCSGGIGLEIVLFLDARVYGNRVVMPRV